MQKNLLTLLSVLTFTLFSAIGSAQGTFDVRFLIDSVDCVNSKLFVDIQVRADNPGQEYFLGDQNYRFSFNRNVLANPQLVQELDVSGFLPGPNYPADNQDFAFYSVHTLTGSLDTIVSYNLELQGGDGLFVTDTDYLNVGRLSLDILDFNTPVYLRWHRDIPADFPNTFVGQKLNGSLVPTAEGSYLDYYQDLSSACTNTTPAAVDDTGTTPEEQAITVCLPTNDSDPENALDNMSVTLLSTPPASEGTVVLDATTGCITFTPAPDFFGTVTAFDYQICDLGVLIPSYQGDNNPLPISLPDPGDPPLQTQPPACTTATINFTVTNVNDAPLAVDDTEMTAEDTPLSSDVTPNDSDVDGDNLTVNTTPITAPANGALTLSANGMYTYTPNANFNGTDSFVYEICDDGSPSLCAQATVNITVTPVNDTPIAADDTESTSEEVTLSSDVTPNDTEPDGDNLVVNTTPVVAPTNGSLTLNSDGTYTYTPAINFNGTDSFTYEVCDDVIPALCDMATVTITVDPVNDAPVALNDNEMTAEDTPLSSDVTPNDTDVDGDNLTVNTIPVTAPANGVLTLSANGMYTYTPNADFNGSDSFVYEICDDGMPSLCATATVTITVTPVNDAPVAVDDTNATPEDTPVSGDVSPNDSDVDADPLTVTPTPVMAPANGTLVLNPNGTYTYTPNADFTGTDSFEYEICDNGSPALCDNAVVTITIDPANDAPVAVDDTETTNEDTPLTLDILLNDSDVDMDPLTATTTPITLPANGTVVIMPNGMATYTPDADFNGTDSFVYEVCDDDTPQLCAQATVTITVDPVNDAPVAADDTETTNEDTPVSSDVIPNDSDVDGDPLTVTTTPVTSPANGTLTLGANGMYTYTPNADFNGTDSFEYEICDNGSPALCDNAVVTITIDPVNDAPVAVDDTNATPEDTPISGDVIPNDSDVDGDNLAVNTMPTAAPTNGTVVLNMNGTYTYTPNPDFNGTDSFRYEVCDDGSPQLCAEATVTITVDPVNDAPVAVDDFGTTPEDVPFNGSTVLSNDTDVDTGDILMVNTTPISTPANGTVTINPDGSFVYSPNAGFNGSDTFEYEVCDNGTPQLCDVGLVTITIDDVNDQPTALDDAATTPEDTPLNGATVLGNDTDIDGNNLTINTTPITNVTNGTLVINPNGTYLYTPNPDYNGTDSFVYEICDDGVNPANLCDQATVVITITPVNDTPVAVDDSGTTAEDVPLMGTTILANDSDVDTGDVLTATATPVTPPANGAVVINPDGTYTYTPNADFNGTDSFVYEVCDNGTPIECTTATVNITVTPVNDAPVAVDDTEMTPEDTPLMSNVIPNDSDVDGDNITVNTTPVVDVTNGTLILNANGMYTYTPNADYFGTDSFEYEICDDGTPSLCATAVVTITIDSVNDAPLAVDDMEMTPEDTPLTSDVTPNDNDVDVADNLTVNTVPVTAPTNGAVTLNANGTYTYTPNPGFFGTDSFVYEICDDGMSVLCAQATVTIDVTSVNDMPVAVDDTEMTPEDTPVSLDVLLNDSDVDTADALTVTTTPVTAPSNGTVALTPTGMATYTPNPDFNGTDTFEYEVCDNGSPILCDVATVTITVMPVNDAPIAVDDSATTSENTPVSSDVSPNDSDVDGNPLTVNTMPVSPPANGTIVLNANGTYTYSPNAGYSGLDMFDYEICDNGTPALCDIATVTISIGAVNDPPIAVDDTATTPEDTPLNGASVLGNDSDIDIGDVLTVNTIPVTNVTNGTLVLNADGTYLYTPNPNFFGTDTFEYEVCDNGMPQLCSTATVTITVDSVNDAPVAADNAEMTPEDTPVTSDVLPNDSDDDTADILAVTATPVTAPMNGMVTLSANGTYTYTPNAGFFGTDTFEYEVCDNGTPVLCDMATVTITVTSVNDAPVAGDDAETTMEDVAISSDVTPNDSDADVADMLTVNITPVTAPTNGTLSLSANGTYTYTPNPNYFGTDSFEYEICDNGNPVLCDVALVDITITSVNDAPVALDDAETTLENTPVSSDVTPNDTDLDVADVLTVNTTPVTPTANGALTLNGDGTYTYTPNPGYNGMDTFEYEICDDGTPQLCDTAIVTIGVGAVNDPPTAVNDSETTAEDTPISSDVTLNDSDLDGDNLMVNTTPVVAPVNGALVLNANGTYTYTPNPNFFGTDSFTYQICDDGMPVLCSTAVVDITITSVNDAPIAVDDSETTLEDTPISSDVTPNDSDADVADVLTVNTTPITNVTNGTLVLNGDGTYTYTPNAGFFGTDTFLYEVCDNGTSVLCDMAMVTITVTSVNDAPVAVGDAETTMEDVVINSDVTPNDSDADVADMLTVNITPVTAPTNGTLSLSANGTYTYTPNPNYFGTDSFEYEICDNGNPVLCDVALVDITITSVNDAPVALDDAETTLENTPISSDVTPNDTDLDVADVLTVNTTPLTPPANGSLTLNGDGTYTYTPNSGYNGMDTFEYEICDNGTPQLCDTAIVTIGVGAVNDPPTAVNDSETTLEDTPISSDVTLNDSDLDGDNLTVNTTPVVAPVNGALVLNANGTYTYTPNPNFFGTDSFTYQICDDGMPVLCSTAVVDITITSVNDVPVAMDDAETTLEDVPVSSDVTPNDSDADVADVLTVNTTPVTPPANGSLTLNADGTYTYTPNASYFGIDSFVYEICDNGTPVECATATVTITVTSDNDAPVAVDDVETTPEDTPISSDVTLNDSDLDGDNLIVNTTPVTPPANGTLALNMDGTYTYTPNPDYFGTDSFVYEVCDDGIPSLCTTATVTIDVTPVNDAPVAVNDTETTLEDTPLTSTVSPNDSDTETGTLTYSVVTGTTNGTLIFNMDGTYTYTPMASFFGTDMFTYEVCDAGTPVLCATATVTITVTSDNDAPIAQNDIGITNEDTPLSSTLAANDSEPDGENLVYTATPVSGPTDGTVVINPDGTYTYTPDLNFNGIDNFTYEVCDDGVPMLCSTAIATIRVNSVNDAPDLVDDAAVTDELVSVDIDVVSNDSDVEDGAIDPCAVTIMTAPLGGTISFGPAPTCVLTYTPNSGFSGVDAFEYEVCDTNGSCSTAIVDVTVNAICLDVQLSVWLEGGLSNLTNGFMPTMRTALSDIRMLLPGQSNSTLPGGQPYNVAPWNYLGTEGAGWADADYASIALAQGAGVVDWIMVSFRTDITSGTTFQRAAALVFEDGSVVFLEPCVLTVSAPSSFYIVIEHRNHMGVMSHIPVSASGGQVNYDFRVQDSWTNGTSFGQIEVEPGKYAMYGGDGDQIPDIFSYDINAVDKTTWLAENGLFGQYLYTDFNLDGDTNGGDKIIWARNNGIASGVQR